MSKEGNAPPVAEPSFRLDGRDLTLDPSVPAGDRLGFGRELGSGSRLHREIAKWVEDQHPQVGGWWRQSVAVGYERIRGLRAVGQGRDGCYTAGKSRTLPVSHEQVRKAIHEGEQGP